MFNMAELKGKYAPYFDLVVDGDKKKTLKSDKIKKKVYDWK